MNPPVRRNCCASRVEAGALAECMKQLTGEQQKSIALAFFYGLSHGELARQMQKPLGTVKTWIRRGLERLKGCLDAGHMTDHG